MWEARMATCQPHASPTWNRSFPGNIGRGTGRCQRSRVTQGIRLQRTRQIRLVESMQFSDEARLRSHGVWLGLEAATCSARPSLEARKVRDVRGGFVGRRGQLPTERIERRADR